MFAKLTILASIAIASQAVTIGQQTAPADTADFSDMSYLENEGAFKEAEARRQKFVAEHLKRVKARSTAAKLYFSAKDTAAEKVRLEGEWNTKWLASIAAHKQAMEHHAKMTAAEKKAFDAKIAATATHLKATEGVSAAVKAQDEAQARLKIAQINVARASKVFIAVKAEQKKRNYVNREEQIKVVLQEIKAFREHVKHVTEHLAARKAQLKASVKATIVAKENHESAKEVEAKAAAEQTAATKAHEAAVAATAEVKKDLDAAAAARESANTSHIQAGEDRKEAILLKAAALAKAKVATNAVRTHVQKMGSFAL